MRNKGKLKIWIIPLIALILIVLWGFFIRILVGFADEQDFDFGTVPYVPGESPHSTGQDSR